MLREVTRWVEGEHDRPLFVFVHRWDVHYDYIPPPPYDTMFDPDYQGRVDGTEASRPPPGNATPRPSSG